MQCCLLKQLLLSDVADMFFCWGVNKRSLSRMNERMNV